MAKKKYRTSGKPKVSGMNEYIYNTLKDDLAKEYKVAKPYKPKKVKQAQIAKKTNLKIYQGSKAELARAKYKGPKFSPLPSAKNKPLKSVTPKGISSKAITKANKAAGIGIGNIMNTESVSKAKFGIPKTQPKVGKYAPKKTVGDVIGYDIAKSAESTKPVAQQRLGGTQFKPSGKKVTVFDTDTKKRKVPGSKYVGGNQPLYKSGTSSPIKKATGKALSGTAKKAVLARGAKLAARGASRLIPGVGTAMLVKDVYDITKWATKQGKSKKKDKIYGTQANKVYKYNR